MSENDSKSSNTHAVLYVAKLNSLNISGTLPFDIAPGVVFRNIETAGIDLLWICSSSWRLFADIKEQRKTINAWQHSLNL